MENSHYGLSEIEYELMNYFWSNGTLSFLEILEYCNDKCHYNWAKTTLHTYLTRLIKKGVLNADFVGHRKFYSPKISKEELAQRYAEQFLKKDFGGSISQLLLSLTYKSKLSEGEVAELKKIIDENINDE